VVVLLTVAVVLLAVVVDVDVIVVVVVVVVLTVDVVDVVSTQVPHVTGHFARASALNPALSQNSSISPQNSAGSGSPLQTGVVEVVTVLVVVVADVIVVVLVVSSHVPHRT
jgi:hypothetical protein